MLYSPKLFVRDWLVGIPLLVSIGAMVFMWWYTIGHIHPTTEQIFLHYNVIFGIDLAGAWWKIFYMPGSGTLIFLLNYFLAIWFYLEDKFLARLLTVITAVWEIFLIIATVLIVGLNI